MVVNGMLVIITITVIIVLLGTGASDLSGSIVVSGYRVLTSLVDI